MKRLQSAVGLFAAAFAIGGRANAQLPSGSRCEYGNPDLL